jgi:hypothetical protein
MEIEGIHNISWFVWVRRERTQRVQTLTPTCQVLAGVGDPGYRYLLERLQARTAFSFGCGNEPNWGRR